MAIEKIKILGAVLEQPVKQHCHLVIELENGPNGINWKCCLSGSSITATRILIFSIAMSADCSFEVENIEI